MEIPNNVEVQRITWKKIGTDILAQLQLERGLFFTIKELLFQPGETVKAVLFTERRFEYTKPLAFLLLTTAIATFLFLQFGNIDEYFKSGFAEGFEYGYQAGGGSESEYDERLEMARELQLKISYVSTKYFNVLILLSLPVYALSSFLFFRKEKLFYTEHLVANMYLIGIQNSFFFLFAFLLHTHQIFGILYALFAFAYQVWFNYGLFTAYSGLSRIWRSIFCVMCCVVGYFIIMMIASILGVMLLPIDLPA